MKLYEVSNFIRKVINVFLVFMGLISAYIYIKPLTEQVYETVKPQTPPEIPYKVDKINFTADSNLNFNIKDAKINYLGNPETQWAALVQKKALIFQYNFSTIEDIDYTPRAKQIALSLGYDDLSQRDNAELSNKYVWTKNGIIFEIDKINKRFLQIPQQPNFSSFKQYLSSGNFVSAESPRPYILRFLSSTGRFTDKELNEVSFEPQFLRFEGNKLIDSNNLSSEISYVKVYRKISGAKVVGKNYDFPPIYFYVSSLRPEIENAFGNYRFLHFKASKMDYKSSFSNYNFDLLPLPNVVSDLKNGNFIISDVKFSGGYFGENPNPKDYIIRSITFDRYELGYYDNFDETIKNEYIQPIYIFKGVAEFNTGERGTIIVYTPAIDPRYFN